jgi:endonuclease/exonuclease/phosphatase family metal-dependent hydrolase
MKRPWKTGTLATAALLLIAGACACSDDDGGIDAQMPDTMAEAGTDAGPDVGGDGPEGDAPVAQAPASFLAYNAGLAHGAVALAEERRPVIIDALKQVTADVICLNEVWTDDDAQAIINALAPNYPHHFREVTTDDSAPTVRCTDIGKVLALAGCQADNCATISTTDCVAGPCQTAYDALTDECKICLAANTADPTTCAIGGAKDFAYDGRNGLMLLSKYPLADATYTPLDTQLIKRGVITADIGGTHVQCTHMPAVLSVVPYPTGGTHSTWADENAAAVTDLIGTAAATGCSVLMGDLNTGPAEGTLAAELPDNYAQLTTAGYSEPWDAPLCTFCSGNPLTGAEEDTWIDHIMFYSCPDVTAPTFTRVLDETVTVTTAEGDIETRLSDHYGVSVALQ